MPTSHLANEWLLLQNQCDSYEKFGLVIKLVAIALLGATLLMPAANQPAIAAVIGVLWLQDAIWKTFQHRIEKRLLEIEAHLGAGQAETATDGLAYQLNTNFQAQRQRGGVLKEYIAQTFRPTVAFPYVVLLLLLVVVCLV